MAKATSIEWHGQRINIVDTPGHADFGGEVERILSMVDGVVLLVDSAEGPFAADQVRSGQRRSASASSQLLSSTRLTAGDARPHEVLDEVFELFLSLDATPEQLDFPILYASGRDGWSSLELDKKEPDLTTLFRTVIDHVPAPTVVEKCAVRDFGDNSGSQPVFGPYFDRSDPVRLR